MHFGSRVSLQAAGMGCSLKEVGVVVSEALDSIDKAVFVVDDFVTIFTSLPIIKQIAKLLEPVVKKVKKMLESTLRKIRKFVDEKLMPVLSNFCDFSIDFQGKLEYLDKAIHALRLVAFPPKGAVAARNIGESMKVCDWMPPATSTLARVMTAVLDLEIFPKSWLATITDWLDFFPDAMVNAFRKGKRMLDTFLGPAPCRSSSHMLLCVVGSSLSPISNDLNVPQVLKFNDMMTKKHKACIPIVGCYEFTLRQLLKGLTGFLESLFDFALYPMNKLIEQVMDPIAAPIKEGIADSLPLPDLGMTDTDVNIPVQDGSDPNSDVGTLLQNGLLGELCFCMLCSSPAWPPF